MEGFGCDHVVTAEAVAVAMVGLDYSRVAVMVGASCDGHDWGWL